MKDLTYEKYKEIRKRTLVKVGYYIASYIPDNCIARVPSPLGKYIYVISPNSESAFLSEMNQHNTNVRKIDSIN